MSSKKRFLHEMDEEEKAQVPSLEKDVTAVVMGIDVLQYPIIIKPTTYKKKKKISIRYYYWRGHELCPTSRGFEIPETNAADVLDGLTHVLKSQDLI